MYKYSKKIIISFFLFGILLINISSTFAVRDIMDIMFEPAKSYEKIIDLWSDKNAVGNEVFKESTQLGFNENFGNGCFVNGQLIPNKTLQDQKNQAWYQWSDKSFCQDILWWDMDVSVVDSKTQAPLIVRITKFLLRMTVVLAITMVLYNGILWIVESAKGGDVKDAKDNIIYIIWGILLALSSVGLINLISSITLSSLNPENMPEKNNDTIVNTTTTPRTKTSWWSTNYLPTDNENSRSSVTRTQEAAVSVE